MSLRDILPSRKFSAVVGSMLLACLLVIIANAVTQPPKLPHAQLASGSNTGSNASWQATLDTIQAQQASRLPTPPDPTTVQNLLQGAQTANLTDSIGRSLLINVTDASAQGLGADQPTQDQLVTAAMQQIQNVATQSKQYTSSDLTVTADSTTTIHAYANALAVTLAKHPHASMAEALNIFGEAINGQTQQLAQLSTIAKAYEALATDLVGIPVPQSIAQYHLKAVNDDEIMAGSFVHMEAVGSDPLRGLAGLQIYNNAAQDEQGMFINIAQVFAKDGILFTKDDPGAQLGSMLSGK